MYAYLKELIFFKRHSSTLFFFSPLPILKGTADNHILLKKGFVVKCNPISVTEIEHHPNEEWNRMEQNLCCRKHKLYVNVCICLCIVLYSLETKDFMSHFRVRVRTSINDNVFAGL